MFHGTKDTGVIVKDKATGNQMLWIPYDSSVTEEGLESYYQNCDYIPMDSDEKESIVHYGGFYVTLEANNQYEALKQVNTESYKQAYDQAQKMYQENGNLNSHLLSKTELAQILAYSNKIGINAVQTKATNQQQYEIKLTSSVGEIAHPKYTGLSTATIENYDTTNVDETIVIEFNKERVIKPAGFKICTFIGQIYNSNSYTGVNEDIDTDIVLKICDKNNEKLRYVWVPVSKDKLTGVFNQLKEEYQKLDVTFWHEDAKDVESIEYKKALESIAAYGGFYIGEAELTYDRDGQTVINQAKGMKINQETGWAGEYWGEYLRGTKVGSYDKAMEIAKNIHKDNSEVVSHLMYGSEWDATMLWLLNTKKVTADQLITNSSTVDGAKYQNTMKLENGALLEQNLKGLNGIYGLAGNLVEVTQESATVDGKTMCVARGGSYLYTGEHYSMASRMVFTEDIIKNGEDIGFRNCLYLNKDAIEGNKYIQVSKEGQVSIKEEYKKAQSKLPTEINIPESYDGITITSVAKKGFQGCSKITKITLPETVNNIYENAFDGCSSLKEINIPDAVTGIASYAFEDCESLKTITIPSKCESIYKNAFKDCTNLEEVIFEGENLVILYNKAFNNCKNLKSITIKSVPQQAEIDEGDFEIESGAFYKCNNLTVLNVTKDMSDELIEYMKKQIPTIKTVNKIEGNSKEEVSYLYNADNGGPAYIKDGKVTYAGENVRSVIPTEKGLYGITYGWGTYLQLTNLETNQRIEFKDASGNTVSYESMDDVINVKDKLYGIAFLTNQYDGTVTTDGTNGFNTTGIVFKSNLDGTGFEVICDRVCKDLIYINRNGKDLLLAMEVYIDNEGGPCTNNKIWLLDITDSSQIQYGEKTLFEKENDEMYISTYAIAKDEILVYLNEKNPDRRELINIKVDDEFFTAKDQTIVGGTKVKDSEYTYTPELVADYERNKFYVSEWKSKTEGMVYEIFDTKEYWPLMDNYHNITGMLQLFEGKDGVEVWVRDRDTKQMKKIYTTLGGKVAW